MVDQSDGDGGERIRMWGTVTGRVQGVGFRAFVRRHGARLGLDGWVRNLPDGRVEFDAAGRPDAIAELRELLGKGPMFGRVERVDAATTRVLTENPQGPEPRSGFRVTA